MVLWVGVDDTDSLRGMCTTFLATEFVRELTRDLDLIGYPRLVRLNPNIPWKTRGNGAIALAVGRGQGEPFQVGLIDSMPVLAYPRDRRTNYFPNVLPQLESLVDRWADVDSEGTDPGLVVLTKKPSPSLYWRAVRGIVLKEEALTAIRGRGRYRGWKSGRGIIGAAAACAWRPRDRTWEILAYRARTRWGTPRTVSPESVRAMDQEFPTTFNNFDYDNDHVVIAPSTPCPVLLGIRGDRASDLPRALETVRCEAPDRWLIFESNQGTDDHVLPHVTRVPRTAGSFEGRIQETPRTILGGHVVFRLDGLDVTAYEPSKQFRNVVRSLAPGDSVRIIGSLRDSPRTVNLEKLEVRSLQEVLVKRSNPLCPSCGVRMKSRGHGGPFRCRRCRRSAPRITASVEVVPRNLELTWYEPPVGSRRHLSKPLKRAGAQGFRTSGPQHITAK
jgi:tRNA(Ile2)-agmatinylcytidine synthase